MNKQKVCISIIAGMIVFVICLMYIISTLIPGVYENYSRWQTISIDNCGTFKVPEEWVMTKEDGFISISNKEGKLLMVETRTTVVNDEPVTFQNKSINLNSSETLSSEVFANSARYGKSVFEIEKQPLELFWIDFYNPRLQAYFVVIDNSVDEKLIRKIAESFVLS